MTSAITQQETAIHPDVLLGERRWLIQQMEARNLALAQSLHNARETIRAQNAAIEKLQAELEAAQVEAKEAAEYEEYPNVAAADDHEAEPGDVADTEELLAVSTAVIDVAQQETER